MASRSPVLGFRLRTRILCRFETEVNGRQKRIFIAAVCEKFCDGSARKTEERFGWGREAIAKGLLERSSEPEEEVRLPRGGVKPSEVRNPQLAIDIRLIVEPHTHSDSERTLRDILNRMNYRLKRIQKGQFRRIRSGGKKPEPTAKVTLLKEVVRPRTRNKKNDAFAIRMGILFKLAHPVFRNGLARRACPRGFMPEGLILFTCEMLIIPYINSK